MTPRAANPWDAMLGGASLLLAGLLAWTIHTGLDEASSATPPAPNAATPAPAPDQSFTLPPLDSFRATVARPLFVPDRRPAAARAPEASVTDLTLMGVVGERGTARAVLRAANGRTLTLAEGESALGWRVVRIANDRVTVENAGIARELRLSGRRTPTPPTEAAPPLPNGLP